MNQAQQTAQVIHSATPTVVSTIRTLGAGPGGGYDGYPNGTVAFARSNGFQYVLQVSSATVDGTITLATMDDPLRRWIQTSGGASGAITLTGPVTGSGTGTIATTIGAGVVTFANINNVAALSLLGNPTGASATMSGITLGAGLGFSGTTLANTAAFGPDVSILLNNSALAAVTANERIVTLTTTTAGSETADLENKLISTGAQVTGSYLTPVGFGVGTKVLNGSLFASGSRVLTVLSVGNGTQAGLELRSGNGSATQSDLAEINVWNGPTKTGRIVWDNVASINSSQMKMYVGNAAATLQLTVSSGGTTVAGNLQAAAGFFNVTSGGNIAASGALTLNSNATPISMTAASTGQTINKSGGGSLTIGTSTNDSFIIRTNGTARTTVAGDGKTGFFGATAVAQPTVGANVNNVVASGTTGQFDDFTSLTVYASDAAAIHADIYQLARSVAQLTVAVRNLGLGA